MIQRLGSFKKGVRPEITVLSARPMNDVNFTDQTFHLNQVSQDNPPRYQQPAIGVDIPPPPRTAPPPKPARKQRPSSEIYNGFASLKSVKTARVDVDAMKQETAALGRSKSLYSAKKSSGRENPVRPAPQPPNHVSKDKSVPDHSYASVSPVRPAPPVPFASFNKKAPVERPHKDQISKQAAAGKKSRSYSASHSNDKPKKEGGLRRSASTLPRGKNIFKATPVVTDYSNDIIVLGRRKSLDETGKDNVRMKTFGVKVSKSTDNFNTTVSNTTSNISPQNNTNIIDNTTVVDSTTLPPTINEVEQGSMHSINSQNLGQQNHVAALTPGDAMKEPVTLHDAINASAVLARLKQLNDINKNCNDLHDASNIEATKELSPESLLAKSNMNCDFGNDLTNSAKKIEGCTESLVSNKDFSQHTIFSEVADKFPQPSSERNNNEKSSSSTNLDLVTTTEKCENHVKSDMRPNWAMNPIASYVVNSVTQDSLPIKPDVRLTGKDGSNAQATRKDTSRSSTDISVASTKRPSPKRPSPPTVKPKPPVPKVPSIGQMRPWKSLDSGSSSTVCSNKEQPVSSEEISKSIAAKKVSPLVIKAGNLSRKEIDKKGTDVAHEKELDTNIDMDKISAISAFKMESNKNVPLVIKAGSFLARKTIEEQDKSEQNLPDILQCAVKNEDEVNEDAASTDKGSKNTPLILKAGTFSARKIFEEQSVTKNEQPIAPDAIADSAPSTEKSTIKTPLIIKANRSNKTVIGKQIEPKHQSTSADKQIDSIDLRSVEPLKSIGLFNGSTEQIIESVKDSDFIADAKTFSNIMQPSVDKPAQPDTGFGRPRRSEDRKRSESEAESTGSVDSLTSISSQITVIMNPNAVLPSPDRETKRVGVPYDSQEPTLRKKSAPEPYSSHKERRPKPGKPPPVTATVKSRNRRSRAMGGRRLQSSPPSTPPPPPKPCLTETRTTTKSTERPPIPPRAPSMLIQHDLRSFDALVNSVQNPVLKDTIVHNSSPPPRPARAPLLTRGATVDVCNSVHSKHPITSPKDVQTIEKDPSAKTINEKTESDVSRKVQIFNKTEKPQRPLKLWKQKSLEWKPGNIAELNDIADVKQLRKEGKEALENVSKLKMRDNASVARRSGQGFVPKKPKRPLSFSMENFMVNSLTEPSKEAGDAVNVATEGKKDAPSKPRRSFSTMKATSMDEGTFEYTFHRNAQGIKEIDDGKTTPEGKAKIIDGPKDVAEVSPKSKVVPPKPVRTSSLRKERPRIVQKRIDVVGDDIPELLKDEELDVDPKIDMKDPEKPSSDLHSQIEKLDEIISQTSSVLKDKLLDTDKERQDGMAVFDQSPLSAVVDNGKQSCDVTESKLKDNAAPIALEIAQHTSLSTPDYFPTTETVTPKEIATVTHNIADEQKMETANNGKMKADFNTVIAGEEKPNIEERVLGQDHRIVTSKEVAASSEQCDVKVDAVTDVISETGSHEKLNSKAAAETVVISADKPTGQLELKDRLVGHEGSDSSPQKPTLNIDENTTKAGDENTTSAGDKNSTCKVVTMNEETAIDSPQPLEISANISTKSSDKNTQKTPPPAKPARPLSFPKVRNTEYLFGCQEDADKKTRIPPRRPTSLPLAERRNRLSREVPDKSPQTLPGEHNAPLSAERTSENSALSPGRKGEYQGDKKLSPVRATRPAIPAALRGFDSGNHVRTDEQGLMDQLRKNMELTDPHCIALFDYPGESPEDLQFKAGSLILLEKQVSREWFFGSFDKKKGMFPAKFVEVIIDLPFQGLATEESTIEDVFAHIEKPHALALHPFVAGNEDELTFESGDTIDLISKIDNDWFEGSCNGKTGIFPATFVAVVKPLPDNDNETAGADNESSNSQIDATDTEISKDFSGRICTAVVDFISDTEGDLNFKVGQDIRILSSVNADWLKGVLRNKTGIFPRSLVKILDECDHLGEGMPMHHLANGTTSEITEIPDIKASKGSAVDGVVQKDSMTHGVLSSNNIPKARATNNFEAYEEGELNFKVDDIIILKRKLDDGWLEGEVNDSTGRFPETFVKVLVPL